METKLRKIYSLNNSGTFSEEELKEVRECELKREELLAKEEEISRLKSRAIWIKEGDNNTKFFHRHATHWKNVNMISTIKDMNGELVHSFKEKAEVGERYFKHLFTEPEGFHIQEILRVLSMFPKLISKEMNNTMAQEVTEEELDKIVYSFQKGKSPGPDGFTIEFYQGFFE